MDIQQLKSEVEKITGPITLTQEIFDNFYLPLIQNYIDKKQDKPYIIGIQGSQGAGKTILAAIIALYLQHKGYNVAWFSIDDFYLSKQERDNLRELYYGNPFFSIRRGLPGTHKYNDLERVLKLAKAGLPFCVPIFDKSLHNGQGDITNKSEKYEKKQDFVILEGWCVGMPAVSRNEFLDIMNEQDYIRKVFNDVDKKKVFFMHVLQFVKYYEPIWKLLDNLTILQTDNLAWVEVWRNEQEEHLKKRTGVGMDSQQIRSFILPFLPFTQLCYHFAYNADCILHIGKDHMPNKLEFKKQ